MFQYNIKWPDGGLCTRNIAPNKDVFTASEDDSVRKLFVYFFTRLLSLNFRALFHGLHCVFYAKHSSSRQILLKSYCIIPVALLIPHTLLIMKITF